MRPAGGLLAVAVVVLLLVGVDLLVQSIAENRIEERARTAVNAEGSIEADIDSFPFLPRLLLAGSVSALQVRLEQVPTSRLQLSAVEVDLRGVEVDRDALLQGEMTVNDIDRGTLSAELDAASLSRALRVPVTVGGGEIQAKVGPARIKARPGVGRDGSLLLRAGPVNLRLSLHRTGLLSCTATRVAVVGDVVRLSCDLDEMPPALGAR